MGNKNFHNNRKGMFVADKDSEDIYSPKVYPKKKTHNFFDDIVLPEVDPGKEYMRNKRMQDKKHKKYKR